MKKKKNFVLLKCILIASLVLSACSNKSSSDFSSAPAGEVQKDLPEAASESEADEYYVTSDEEPLYEAEAKKEFDVNPEDYSSEEYLEIVENKEINTLEAPVTTFSLKMDTATYNNVSRYINNGNMPPVDAVKIEELINYFKYDKVLEENETPFSIYTELGTSPFDADKNLAFVRVKSKNIDRKNLPKTNLTFLIDTSGSMDSYDKLPLLKSAFSLLVENLTENDKVSIVTYAGSSGVVLDGVTGERKEEILSAINNLSAAGSTAGAKGISTAYELAEKNFIKGGNNRVILATDGDFNVGPSNNKELEKIISKKKDSGVYLSTLGFGTGNYQDDTMETLSKHGNGNYGYIDSEKSAKKLLVDELTTNLFSVADDVKAQIEFNPDMVSTYRLIGYENRKMRNEDFNDDTKDAGEIGIDTDSVLLFEFQMKNKIDGSVMKYQGGHAKEDNELLKIDDELFKVKIRYKNPGEAESKLIEEPIKTNKFLGPNSTDFNFATSVAEFGHILRESSYAGNVTFDDVINKAKENIGKDEKDYRKDFVEMVTRCKDI